MSSKNEGDAGRKHASKSRQPVIVLEDSDSEEDKRTSVHAKADVDAVRNEASTSSLSSILGDRAQMERERLARQKKRMHEASPPDQRESKSARKEDFQTDHASASLSKASANVELYWKGTIKKSFNQYSPNTPGTRFESFLRPTTPFKNNGLTHVIMATYCEDIQWLAQMFPKGQGAPEITMITLESRELRAGVFAPLHPQLPNWIRLVVPRKGLSEWTTMHMKFMLLFYKDRMRLLLLSGNMVEYDWTRIENTAFIHDFPKAKDGDVKSDSASSFGNHMHRVLSSLSVPPGHFAMNALKTYDTRSTGEAQLVISMPTFTPITGWTAMEEVGLGRLAKVSRDILRHPSRGSKVVIEAQGSSMGTYSPRWLQQMHIICSGFDYRRILPLPSGAKANAAWATATGERETDKWPAVRLLFPSDGWVKTQSIEGVAGAGTFFGKSKAAVEKGFVELLHQPVSNRGNIMMHHKSILTLKKGKEDQEDTADDKEVIGWVYMGSHNLTQAAWGNISQAKGASEPQLTIGNWELGIVLPVRASDLLQAKESGTTEPDSMAANVITWQRPAAKYAPGQIPWDQFAQ